MKAKGLKRGDVLGVVALASPPNQQHLKNGLERLEAQYQVKFKLANNLWSFSRNGRREITKFT